MKIQVQILIGRKMVEGKLSYECLKCHAIIDDIGRKKVSGGGSYYVCPKCGSEKYEKYRSTINKIFPEWTCGNCGIKTDNTLIDKSSKYGGSYWICQKCRSHKMKP